MRNMVMGGNPMDRARSILKVGVFAIGVMIVVALMISALYDELLLHGTLDLVWKVLVLLLLVDISLKLGSRGPSNTNRDGH